MCHFPDNLLKLCKLAANRRLFLGLALYYLAGIFRKGSSQCIRVPRLEKYQITGWLACGVLFQREINAILAGNALKGFDVAVCNLNVGNACALPDKVLDRKSVV